MNEMPDIPASLDRRKPAAPKPLVWSYTLLHTYRSICAHQAFRRFLLKDIPFQETLAMKRGNEVHSAMEYRVSGGKPLPADMRQWEPLAAAFDGKGAKVENWVGITIEGKACDSRAGNVWGRGKIDLYIVKDTTAFLLDYKTGKVREEPFELEVQSVFLHAKFPQLKKIMGQYAWLAENRIGKMYDLSNTAETWQTICATVRAIQSNRRPDGFDKKQSGLCGWCPVTDCEYNRLQQ